jgi:acetyl esterase/lipase
MPESSGLLATNSLLDGGAPEWPLFNESTLPPDEMLNDTGAEFIQRNDPSDWCSKGDQAGYSVLSVKMPTLVAFAVPQDQKNRLDAAVIVAPGGGSRFLSWNKEGTRIAKWLNSIGISAYVLKYRVPANSAETHNKMLIDSQRAIRVVRSHAEAFPFMGINSSRIGFMGFSQGAFITGRVATTKDRAYTPVDKQDEVSHLPDFAFEIYGYGQTGTAPAPPTFIAIAENDPCVSPLGAMAYYGNLQEERRSNDNIHELHVFSDGHHGYGDCSLFVDGDAWEPVCSWTVNAQVFMERLFGIQKPLNHKPMLAPSLRNQ